MNLYQKWCLNKAKIKLKRLRVLYSSTSKILDIGSGNGALCYLLKKEDIDITALDIKDRSVFNEISPVLYNGNKLPFENDAFDVVQIITVLHHIKDPDKIVLEAKRVGKQIIIMEDIYENWIQKWLTFIADSINNWEIIGHPHSNKTDEQWKAVFKKYDLNLESVRYYNFLAIFKQVTYVLFK